ncbi:Serine carboxypeptidase [Brevundimonas sp. SH203]|uniref:S10 family serine carboxypeptidase-like protein n=1 Tax=Brevundimonas sp. SH203 TaxID=345167 RepID=UPI0009D4E410|nr:hypothetical protein [Brevundimonas sp. SH203]GAW41114.1 Serine carboxypeptidase [Brevundimonas sp. SH203]
MNLLTRIAMGSGGLACALALTLMSGPPAHAAETPSVASGQDAAPPPTVTHHSLRLARGRLDYQAEIGRIAIRDVETSEARGHMGYVAYRAPGREPRPLIFIWNGGPGANSATLHFEAAGPLRGEDDHLVDNAETWLSAADLVFVDPIGTGFSRPTSTAAADEFYGTVGDVASVAEFVRSWLLLHDAQDRRVFLAGESWGAGRAANVGYRLLKQGVPISGLILISGGDGLDTAYVSPETATALHVIDLAPVALFHHRLPPELGLTPEAARAAAEAWVGTTYAPALARRAELTDAQRNAVIADLSRFTGVPADRIDPAALTFTPRQYLQGLLQDQGRTLNVFDMRLTESPRIGFTGAIDRYLRRTLNYVTDLAYVGLDDVQAGYAPYDRFPAGVGARWNYATVENPSPEAVKAAIDDAVRRGGGPPRIGPPLPATEEALALSPTLKVLIASGRYDSLASCARDAAVAQTLPPSLRFALTYRCYDGGHMFYRNPAARLQFSQDVADMVSR